MNPTHTDTAQHGEITAIRIARLMSSHPEENWSLGRLAAEIHLSVSQMSRIFTQHFRVPPMHYLTRIRAHRLARLLVGTDLPVGAAMREVGWHSRGHAARQFTMIMGMTPSRYRMEYRRRHPPAGDETQGGPDEELEPAR